SIAVCYLFSFINPKQEQRTAAIIHEEHPTARVSLSSVVLPLIREYLRLSTTVLDAYVGPVVANYLRAITGRLRETGLTSNKLFIMHATAGWMKMDSATNYPMHPLPSAAAAGSVLAAGPGKLTGAQNIVPCDVGGTSTNTGFLNKALYKEPRHGRIHDQD